MMEMMRQMAAAQGGGAGPMGGMGGGAGPQGGGRGVIQVTQEEKSAIDRLKAMGFPEHAAAEAYMVCDKNEELAANYLFNAQDQMGGFGFGGGAAAAQQPAAAPQQPAADAAAQPEQAAQGDSNNADADNSGDSNASGDASGDSNASTGN